MPYRLDLTTSAEDAAYTLVELGALDVEMDGANIAVLLPDAVSPDDVVRAVGATASRVSAATGRDDDSVWVLTPRVATVAGITIAPAGAPAPAGAVQLVESAAFGTGLHPTTVLCLEVMRDIVEADTPPLMLDLGTGSGVLALAALAMGVPRAVAVDRDAAAIEAASRNARINGYGDRLQLVRGTLACVGRFPLIVANIQAGPLIELAPELVQRVEGGGRLVLSGIAASVLPEVEQAYVHLGMRRYAIAERAGWAAVTLHPTW